MPPAASDVPQSPLVPGNAPPANENGAPSAAKPIAETGPPPMLRTMNARSPLLPRPTGAEVGDQPVVVVGLLVDLEEAEGGADAADDAARGERRAVASW